MKIFRLLCTVTLVGLITIPCLARKSINFGGKWNHVKKTIVQELPVKAWVEEDNRLFVSFSNLEVVHITIINSLGKIVYDEFVNTTNQPFLSITFNKVINIDYSICITSDHLDLYGYFDLYK